MIRPVIRLACLLTALSSGLAVAQDIKAGPISIVSPWARATPGGSTVAAAYLEIRAPQGVEDRLLSARSPIAGTVELHDHVAENGVMRMRRVEAIAISGSTPVVLAPSGMHVMLMDLKGPLKAGDQVEMTLVFEKAGPVTFKAPIKPIGSQGEHQKPAGGHGGHHGGRH